MIGQQIQEKPAVLSGSTWLAALQSPEYARVEKRILRQLVESLLFERIIDCSTSKEPISAVSSESRFVMKGVSTEGLPLIYQCWGSLKISFGRIRLSRQKGIERVGPDGVTSEARLEHFLGEVLAPLIPVNQLPMFIEELEQTLIKDTQAQYVNPNRELSGLEREYDALEANVMDGHPYHPCYKSRIGFNLDDNWMYGPEFKPMIKPVWLAVARDESSAAYSSALHDETWISSELGEEVVAGFRSKLAAFGKDLSNYRLIPVHPWQWRETIIRVFHRQLADGRIILIGEGAEPYAPQQSIRTLANVHSKEKPYLKLPMSLTNTSTSRMLAKHTVLNAPLISDWLYSLVQDDPDAKRLDFVLLREVAGVAYDHETWPEKLRSRAYGALGAIWRESLHPYLRGNEQAVPYNALTSVDRSSRLLIDPWVQDMGVEAWTNQLLQVTIEPLIHLLFAHGVALETHAQNIILIHCEGVPVRVAFKDFHDGIRFSREHLANPAGCPRLYTLPAHHARINPNSFIETKDASIVRDFVHDAFFFINLTELCLFLEEHYELSEAYFWEAAAQIIHRYRQAHPQHEVRYQAFDLFAETIQVEQLTARRLFGDSEVRLQEVPNPLHRFR
ncbi:IucA/IucC family siderophore biosynthesis protein [Paenibacillus sp. HWE-109]|uniref:IucA/IucC family protein n=1 Tax=Paenibacillus sp. HWE-109 TaxID=1306526 RepID=UPI001EDFB505|nr:IucA/IucC family protein [Paenibacillus sp. HWE-109]UKS28459.1 IucA/IucC family siderophore biosynthesis protein [Paenibacillus sp. HWE-109]